MRRSSELAFALACVLFASAAGAQTTDVDRAKVLYNDALEMRDAGDNAGALALLRAAFAKVRSPVIGLELARTHVRMSQLVEANAVVTSIATIPIAPEETENSVAARTEAAKLGVELQKRVATLRVKITGPRPTAIFVDGTETKAFDAPLSLDPGKHVVFVTLDSAGRREITLAEGESRELTFDLTPKPVAPAPEPPRAPPAARPSYTLVYAGLAAAGVGIVVGSVTGVIALSRGATLRDECPTGRCGADHSDDVNGARVLTTVSTISFAVATGGALVALFGVVRATDTAPAKVGAVQPVIGLGSLGIVGSF
jgi:hypothetical protein